jgi:hypothetical protein
MARTSYFSFFFQQVTFQLDDVCFVLGQHAKLDFYTASSLKQLFMVKFVAPLQHIIL